MRLDLPEPEMPVTQINSPSGNFTSMLRRLFSRAPRHGEEIAVAGAAGLRHGNALAAGEVIAE